jgi:hypothetical protein
MSGWVRPAAVAGHFYPADPAALRRTVGAQLDEAARRAGNEPAPKAVIAPHAGYRYSGPVAATAYATLAPARGVVRRVLLAGPSHFVPVSGLALSSAGAFATPLGPVPVDEAARAEALAVDGVEIDDTAHAGEHSLEVHLPFVVAALGDVEVLPMLVGRRGEVLAEVFDSLWDGAETCIVVSTDLSHYHDDATARALDRETAAAIVERLEPPRSEQACGAVAVGGLLTAARRRGLSARLLDLRTSADTAGGRERVVGYGAFALT